MSYAAPSPGNNDLTVRDKENTLAMRIVNSNTLPEWSSATDGSPPCLLYLVALDRPRIRSNLAMRLRLKDSLAGGQAGRNAGVLAKDPHFWDYLQQINLTAYDAEIDAPRARYFINRVCAVSSRHELNRHEAAAQRFFTLIEKPFLDWLQASGND